MTHWIRRPLIDWCAEQGHTARDCVKLLMGLAREQPLVAMFAVESDLCPVVAAGLSGVFSALPRVLPADVERRGAFTAGDIVQLGQLNDFVTSLEFCDSVPSTSIPDFVDFIGFQKGFTWFCATTVTGLAVFSNGI